MSDNYKYFHTHFSKKHTSHEIQNENEISNIEYEFEDEFPLDIDVDLIKETSIKNIYLTLFLKYRDKFKILEQTSISSMSPGLSENLGENLSISSPSMTRKKRTKKVIF